MESDPKRHDGSEARKKSMFRITTIGCLLILMPGCATPDDRTAGAPAAATANAASSDPAAALQQAPPDVPTEASPDAPGQAQPDPGVTRLGHSITSFGVAVWGALEGRDNQVISPTSLLLAMAMPTMGASSRTRAELEMTLRLGGLGGVGDADAVDAAVRGLRDHLDGQSTFRMANRLFGQRGYPFEQAYVDRLRRAFGAPLAEVDFQASPAAARTAINTWVSERTEQRIRDLLPPPAVTSDTRFVLVNAAQFQANWATPFDPARTTDVAFQRADGDPGRRAHDAARRADEIRTRRPLAVR